MLAFKMFPLVERLPETVSIHLHPTTTKQCQALRAGEQVAGIYEADYRDFNRETYVRGRETFDATYAAFKRLLIGIWRRDAHRAAGGLL